MRFALFAIALGLLASGLASRPALAATSTASFGVTATVQSSCQATAPVSAFGNYATAGASPVSVSCTHPTPYNVSLSADLTASAAMKMTGPAKALLGYGLLLNSAHTNERGRTAGMDTLAGSGNGSSRAQASYSQTAQARYVSSGAFADAITVTVTY